MPSTIAAVVSPETIARPVLIDEKDGLCEFCAKWRTRPRGACCRCGEMIGAFENMGGAGFQSVRPHHYHLEAIADVMGRRGVFEELCLGCYRESWREAYPSEPYPMAPRTLTEPKLPPEITRAVIEDAELTGVQ